MLPSSPGSQARALALAVSTRAFSDRGACMCEETSLNPPVLRSPRLSSSDERKFSQSTESSQPTES